MEKDIKYLYKMFLIYATATLLVIICFGGLIIHYERILLDVYQQILEGL